jgi:hypothetical protein
MNGGCDWLRAASFGRDYLPPHFVSIWIIPHHSHIRSRLTPLGLVSVTVPFHDTQFHLRVWSVGIYLNRDSLRCNEFQPQLTTSRFHFIF